MPFDICSKGAKATLDTIIAKRKLQGLDGYFN
jgi:hypothetical protein